jgi:hypothetical protein
LLKDGPYLKETLNVLLGCRKKRKLNIDTEKGELGQLTRLSDDSGGGAPSSEGVFITQIVAVKRC